MSNEANGEDVFWIEVMVPQQGAAAPELTQGVKVLFVADDPASAIAMSGQVASSCPTPLIQEDGERLFRLQIEVSVEEVLSLWNSRGDTQPSDAPRAISFSGNSNYRVGKLIGTCDPVETPGT